MAKCWNDKGTPTASYLYARLECCFCEDHGISKSNLFRHIEPDFILIFIEKRRGVAQIDKERLTQRGLEHSAPWPVTFELNRDDILFNLHSSLFEQCGEIKIIHRIFY